MPYVSEFGFCAAAIMTICTYGPAAVQRLKRVRRIARAHARIQASIKKLRRF